MEADVIKLIAAALAIGVGAIGPGIAVGLIGGRAVEAISRNPEAESNIRNTMILALVFAESTVLYALVISLILLFLF